MLHEIVREKGPSSMQVTEKRAFITLWVLFFNIFVLTFFGVIPGVAYIFFWFPFLLVCYTLCYSPYLPSLF